MARIRTIKPEFPHSESMGKVSRDARLAFILLWTIADDSGRLRGNSRMLASLLFPYDDDAPKKIDEWLGELQGEGCVARYEANGNHYIQIEKWTEHQRVDKPSPSKIPPFCESSRTFANAPGRIKDQGMDQGEEEERVQREEMDNAPPDGGDPAPADPPLKPKRERFPTKTRLRPDFTPPDEWGEFAVKKGFTYDEIPRIWQRFRDHHLAHASAFADWFAAWRKWINNEIEFAKRRPK